MQKAKIVTWRCKKKTVTKRKRRLQTSHSLMYMCTMLFVFENEFSQL